MNTFLKKLEARVDSVDSLLCVGIDVEYNDGAPTAEEQVYKLVDKTLPFAAAYKINAAHFLAKSLSVLDLAKTVKRMFPERLEVPVIIDWKCCADIQDTAEAWASLVFDKIGADAVTLSPYMGIDNMQPWFKRNKGVFVLCRTSNDESDCIQNSQYSEVPLYERVALYASQTHIGLSLVFGAGRTKEMSWARSMSSSWFLVPGVGAQGADLEDAVRAGLREDGKGILINVSRGISRAQNPGLEAEKYRDAIRKIVWKKKNMTLKSSEEN